MTDKKLTDNEIIKALQEMADYPHNYEEGQDLQNALDLITRQQAEIERLKECPKCVYEYDGEITEYCVQGPCSNFKTVEQVKAEAYKECIEKVKEKARKIEYVFCGGALVKTDYTITDYTITDYTITDEELDNIIKETETERGI